MTRPLVVNAVGDISLGDHPVCVGHGMRAAFANKGSAILDEVSDILSDADVALGNLETAVSEVGLKRYWLPSYEMRGDPAALRFIKDAGVHTLSIANNHTMQHGIEAFQDTVHSLRALGFNVIGLDSGAGKPKPYVIEHDGVSCCIFSLSMRPDVWTEGCSPYSLYDSAADLLYDVRDLRAQHRGFLVCSIHWGLEFLNFPGPDQISLAHSLIDAGVDVVFGHHSHVLQPVERYRSGLIFYSLGNFVFDLWQKELQLGVVAKVSLQAGRKPAYRLLPVTIKPDFSVTKADAEQERTVLSVMAERPISSAVFQSSSYEYEQQYSEKARINRRSAHRYFLKNISRYSINFIIQSLLRTAFRRITGQ